MPGGSSGSQTVQTTNSAPWVKAQPYFEEALGGAHQAYLSGAGFDYPSFPTTVPFASQTSDALTGIEGLARGGNPLGTAAQGATLGILNSGGMTPWMQSAGQGFQGMLGNLSRPSAVNTYLTPYASGANVTGGSPEFLKALDFQSGLLRDDIDRNKSFRGRSGSMAHANELVDRIGALRTGAIANEIAREQGQQMQAAGMLSGEQQTGIANQLGLLGNMASLGAVGAGNLATFTGMAPGVYEQGFLPYGKLAGVGSAYEDQFTRAMNEQIARWEAEQQESWRRLAAYNALIGGAGSMGGSTSTSVPKPSPLQGAISGGLLGGSLGAPFLPPWGMLGGAALGGLAGLFG